MSLALKMKVDKGGIGHTTALNLRSQLAIGVVTITLRLQSKRAS